MNNFKRVNATKEDVFEEFIFRALGKFEGDGISSYSVVADFMRENNFSNIKAGEINIMIDKLCELANDKGEKFSNRVCDELNILTEMAKLTVEKISGDGNGYIAKLKRELKASPYESMESIGQRLLGLN